MNLNKMNNGKRKKSIIFFPVACAYFILLGVSALVGYQPSQLNIFILCLLGAIGYWDLTKVYNQFLRSKPKDYRIELEKMLDPYVNLEYEYFRKGIEHGEEYQRENLRAKKFLEDFYKYLETIPVEISNKELDLYVRQKCNIFKNNRLNVMKNALEEKRYISVCNELQSFIHFYPIEHPAIHINILALLDIYLIDSEKENVK